MSVCVPTDARWGVGSPGARHRWCEPPNMGAGNRTGVLCKGSMYSQLLSRPPKSNDSFYKAELTFHVHNRAYVFNRSVAQEG